MTVGDKKIKEKIRERIHHNGTEIDSFSFRVFYKKPQEYAVGNNGKPPQKQHHLQRELQTIELVTEFTHQQTAAIQHTQRKKVDQKSNAGRRPETL